jgi:hypothetical protein
MKEHRKKQTAGQDGVRRSVIFLNSVEDKSLLIRSVVHLVSLMQNRFGLYDCTREGRSYVIFLSLIIMDYYSRTIVWIK